jgi:hypothetical protein
MVGIPPVADVQNLDGLAARINGVLDRPGCPHRDIMNDRACRASAAEIHRKNLTALVKAISHIPAKPVPIVAGTLSDPGQKVAVTSRIFRACTPATFSLNSSAIFRMPIEIGLNRERKANKKLDGTGSGETAEAHEIDFRRQASPMRRSS